MSRYIVVVDGRYIGRDGYRHSVAVAERCLCPEPAEVWTNKIEAEQAASQCLPRPGRVRVLDA